jgi:cytoskeletal protein RodZ
MTYENEPERRKASVGGKVLVFGVAIFAVLGAFWTVVWFIRSYVEQPRIALRAPMTLASRESEPVAPPREPVATASMSAPTADPAPPPQASPSAPAERLAATAQATVPQPAAEPAPPAGPIADRWFPTTPSAQWPDPPNNAAPAPAAQPEPAAALNDQAEPEVVVASMEPAIRGAVPRPRPKPPTNSISARLREPPLPRPRPDGPAPQSVWTASPVTDDRFPASSQ